jgi:hypothetical protein
MTFNPTEHPRANDGKFAEKLGSAAEVSLDAGPDFEKLAAKANRAGKRSGDKRLDITDGDAALVEELTAALRDPRVPESVFDAAATFAERLEDANFHSAVRRLDAAVGEAAYRSDPSAPVKNPAAVMQASADMDLVRTAADQYGSRIHQTYLETQDAATAAEWAQERIDNNLVFNPNLDEELARELHGRVTGWRRSELLANPSLPADLR